MIEKSRLGKLCAAMGFPMIALGLLFAWAQFEIHFERRNYQDDMRHEEHQAASKLAQIEMELWSHYREDIHESNEAESLLRSLNASYDEFKMKLQSTILGVAKDLGLEPGKASALTGAALELIANHRQENIQQTKDLVDHLVIAGKKSAALQTYLDDEIVREMQEESRHIAEYHEGLNEEQISPEDEKLSTIINGFFLTYQEFSSEFSAAIQSLHAGSQIHEQLQSLYAELRAQDAPFDWEVEGALRSIHQQEFIPPFRKGANSFMQTLPEFLEVLVMTPRIPHETLSLLEREWQTGKKDPYSVLMQLHELEVDKKVPGYWLERAMAIFESGELQG